MHWQAPPPFSPWLLAVGLETFRRRCSSSNRDISPAGPKQELIKREETKRFSDSEVAKTSLYVSLLWLPETGNISGNSSNQHGWQHGANKTLLFTTQFQTKALPSLSWSIYSKSSQDPVIHYVQTELIFHLLGCKTGSSLLL